MALITPRSAAELLLARRAARRSMIDYVTYLDLGFVPAKHHQLMCNKLDAVERGEIKKLMLFLPPGAGKSKYGSELFPTYYLGRNPTKSILACSHTQPLADRFGRRTRNLFALPEHAALFGVSLARDSQAASYWSTDREGEYFAAGVGVAISGRRADCLTGDTIVTTLDGDARIDEITGTDYVLSYDQGRKALTYGRVIAIARRHTDTLFRVYTSAGNMVEATGNHRFLTARGWTAANALGTGNVLLRSVWNGMSAAIRRDAEVGADETQRPILQSEVLNDYEQREARVGAADLSTLRATSAFTTGSRAPAAVLLDRMFPNPTEGSEKTKDNNSGAFLRNLWADVSPTESESAGKVLLAKMQGCRPFSRYVRRRESWIPSWHKRARESAGLVSSEAGRLGARLLSLCSVLQSRQPTSAPHKHDPNRSSAGESCSSVRFLSQEIARCGAITAAFDTVARVERVRRKSVVYDIQVEGTGCFFANGILVHNCGIIDDPVKGHEDADSESKQASNWEWYLSDFLPRLKPNAAQVIIQTRWSEGDLAGRILEREASEWEVVELAMEADTNDPLGRQPGERLWSEWFTAEQVDIAKRDARSWSALYQQRPVADEGEYFHRDWFPEFEHIPDNANYYGASDYAVTAGGGDFTEHGVFALDSFGNLYVVDWWRGQTESELWVEKQCDFIQEYFPLIWFGESGPIRRAIEPYMALRMTERNAMCRMEWLPSLVKKELRLRSFQALASRNKVFLPKAAAWKGELLQQLTHFPVGRHDDGVDVCSLMGRGLDQVAAPRMKRWTRNEPQNSSLREADALTWMSS